MKYKSNDKGTSTAPCNTRQKAFTQLKYKTNAISHIYSPIETYHAETFYSYHPYTHTHYHCTLTHSLRMTHTPLKHTHKFTGIVTHSSHSEDNTLDT